MAPTISSTPQAHISRRAKLQRSVLPGALGARLSSLENILFSGIQLLTAKHGLTPSEFGVLLLIAENPGLSQTDLGRAIKADRSTMVAIVDRFEERKLAERQSSPYDRRAHALCLTATGSIMVGSLQPEIAVHEANVLVRLSPSEQTQLADLLDKIIAI
jgi:DNA-binding MarR family transcriptional regulator